MFEAVFAVGHGSRLNDHVSSLTDRGILLSLLAITSEHAKG